MKNDQYESDQPSDREEIPVRGILDSLLVTIRIMASIGAAAAIVFGVVLAAQLFTFFRGIIEDPDTIIVSWQQAMDKGRPTTIPAPADGPVTPAQPVSETKPVVYVPESENTPVATPVAAVTPIETPVEAPVEAPEKAPVETPAETQSETPTQGNTDEREAHHRKRADKPEGELTPFIALADRVMERLELGEFSWLIGVGFLVLFCWLLLKIPVMLITTGSRLLIAMVNVSTES